MPDQMHRSQHWAWNVLAYGLWIISALLTWVLLEGSRLYLPSVLHVQVGNLLLAIIPPLAQAIFSWLILQTLIHDRRLPWLIAVTLVGYVLGLFLVRYFYSLAYLFFHLIPGNTVRTMLLSAAMDTLVTTVSVAIFQVLFLGSILRRINSSFALGWIIAATVAGIVAPVCSVLFLLKNYSSSALYPSLIQSALVGLITGLPLLWLRARPTPDNNSKA